jgi:hypothetical protein
MRAERSAPTPRRISSRLRLRRHPRLNPQPHLSSSTFHPVLAPQFVSVPLLFMHLTGHRAHGHAASTYAYTATRVRAPRPGRPAHPIWAHRCMLVRPICYDGHAERATHSNGKQKCTHERTWHGTGRGTEWLGRIRIWQWPLGRHSQISRTAVFPFNHGDGDQSHFAGWFHTLIWLSQSKKKGSCEPRVKSWVMVLSLSETTAAQTQQCERYKVTDYSFTVRVK